MQTQILIGLFFCHLLGDYTPLSTEWMLNAKRVGKPLYPIFIHALVHALLMLVLLTVMFKLAMVKLFILFGIQLITHFVIDVCKGRVGAWFPILQSPNNKWYWIVFGIDQYLHTLVIIAMSFYATS